MDSWEEVVSALFREHYLPLVRLAVNLTDDQLTAEDIVQEAFAGLYRMGSVRGADIEDRPGYLRTTVVNRSRSVLRRRRTARAWVPPREQFVEAADEPTMTKSESMYLRAGLRRLPSRQREVLVLRYYEDLSVSEIARMLGISPRAVSSSLGRGFASLRKFVGGHVDE